MVTNKKEAFVKKLIARAAKIAALRESGMAITAIARKLHVDRGTVYRDLEKPSHVRLISRKTWKLGSVVLPTKPGKYWVTFSPKGTPDDSYYICELNGILESKHFETIYWCGPIPPPVYDPEEINAERKLREVTK